MGDQFVGLSRRRPAGRVPAVAHDRNHVDERAAAQRIGHEMRIFAEPEPDQRCPHFRGQRRGRQGCAPGAAVAEFRLG